MADYLINNKETVSMEQKDRKAILMICSWLDVEKKTGSFFWEQAELMRDDFEMFLCHFKKINIKAKNISYLFKRRKVEKKLTPNKLPIYFVDYLYMSFLPKKINVLLFKFCAKKFHCFLLKNQIKIDLIHAQSLFQAGLEARILNKLTEIPFIFTEHNQFSLRNKSREEIRAINKILTSPYPNLIVSFDKIRQFAANGFFAKFEVVGNSVDEKLFYYNPSIISQNIFTITTIGSCDPLKNQETILKALKLIDRTCSAEINFNWIGYNSWGIDLQSKVDQIIELFDFNKIKIHLFPQMSREDIANKLRESDLFLLSSISEGMPVSVLEALSCGVPVCSTRCGGVDEIIDVSNGFIVQIMDYKAMARFTLHIINKTITYNSENISRNILRKYGNQAFSRRLKEIYFRAINLGYDKRN